MKTVRKQDTRIPRRPLLWLAAALLFTLPPMFGTLPSWVPLLFLVALAAKFWMEPKGYRLRSLVWKLVLVVLILSLLFFGYGSVRGIEPGVSLIVMLTSIKILEAHTAREFHIMVMVAWVLCLCGFFLSQSLAIALCLLIAFTLLLVALIQFHRGSSSAFWPPVRTAGKLLAQAAPLIILLFLFFPRVTTGLRFQIAPQRGSSAGFSDRLSPGSVSSLANSSEVAFRAEFPDGKIPPLSAMYWRGVVMRHGEGLEWEALNPPAALPRISQGPPHGEAIRQWITIEPHEARWMFALDWPVNSPSGAMLAPGNYLWSSQPIHKPRRYEVASYPEIPNNRLHSREREPLLQVPASISPAVRALAQSWMAEKAEPRAIVNKALEFFRTQGFQYSLSPGAYGKNDLDEFLFHRRLGFCEHYAASFATLMRLAGIPARVVTGYLGGEYNEIGRFFLVRQADAHAWCEVWFPDTGWQRVDPTAVVAADRVNLGFNYFLERRGAAAGQLNNTQSALAKKLAGWPIFARARLGWQTLSYTWDTRVLSFDGDEQESFFASVGMAGHGPIFLIVGIVVIAIALLTLYAGWTRWRTRPCGDRVKIMYESFCRKAAKLGAPRNPAEGPLDFSHRATCLLPNDSERIRSIAKAYIALRYASAPDPTTLEQFAKEVNAFVRTS
jgi:transglutaminase-like putative cysteine protease